MIRIDSNVLQFERFFSRPYSFESGTDSSPLVRFSLHRRAIFGLALLRSLLKRGPFVMELQQLEELFFYVTIGVIIGGRLGYVLFYNPGYFFYNPLEILMIWRGGMSFHGGLLGVSAVGLIISYRKNIPLLQLTDLLAAAAPIGLFFGRITNFINGELYGRVSNAPWAVIFPNGGPLPRHPSQLYEAAFEGFLLFTLLGALAFFTKVRYCAGILTSLFLLGYGTTRAMVEFFREPDPQLGFFMEYFTMGHLLCLPMIVAGIILFVFSIKHSSVSQ